MLHSLTHIVNWLGKEIKYLPSSFLTLVYSTTKYFLVFSVSVLIFVPIHTKATSKTFPPFLYPTHFLILSIRAYQNNFFFTLLSHFLHYNFSFCCPIRSSYCSPPFPELLKFNSPVFLASCPLIPTFCGTQHWQVNHSSSSSFSFSPLPP